MTFEQIRLDVVDGIATITLDRPEKLNAFSDIMEGELMRALGRVDDDDEVRALVLTGSGHAFCAGMDLGGNDASAIDWGSGDPSDSEGGSRPSDELRRDGGGRVVLRMFEMRKPVIAAINGPAVGVGLTMTLAADFRLAVPAAKLGLVFARRGLVPESCSSWFLPRLVGMQTALEWVYSGRLFSSEDALTAGLVRSLHDPAELLDDAHGLAVSLTESSAPVSLALSRQMLWRLSAAPHPVVAHEVETLALNARLSSRDAEEGIAAFLEKRPAAFIDKVSRDSPEVFGTFEAPEYRPVKKGK
ncbi:crotonase/enoyl-CoA hydratase family protein [Aeromicrobium panaciterrae]|uniref:crotonase/enoyl-CoA hydratase family protein n=1 Tax=Aeromicrobium panaciterrae TaxID=363861 RepID=UPI0031DCD663